MNTTAQNLRAAFAALLIAMPEAVVTVAWNGASIQAINRKHKAVEMLTQYGEQGKATGFLTWDLSQMAAPPEGAAITVNGDGAICQMIDSDNLEALVTVQYLKTNPVKP